MIIGLDGHKDKYNCSWNDIGYMMNGAPYAYRHLELSASLNDRPSLKWTHRVIACLEFIPLLGAVVALIEKVVNDFFRPAPLTPESNSKLAAAGPPPAEQRPAALQTFIQRYVAFSKEEREDLNRDFQELVSEENDSQDDHVRFEEIFTDERIHSLFDKAEEIFSSHKNQPLFAIGQSPAWLMEAYLITHPESANLFRHLAFSGDWYGLFDKTEGELIMEYPGKETSNSVRVGTNIAASAATQKLASSAILEKAPASAPNQEQIAAYRNYLTRLGCTPQRIAEGPVVFVDYVVKGSGLRSFLDILYAWAQEENIAPEVMKKNIHLHLISHIWSNARLTGTLDNEPANNYFNRQFMPLAGKVEISCFEEPVQIYQFTKEPKAGKAGTKTGSEKDVKRLIKKFPKDEWVKASQSDFSTYYEGAPLSRELIFSQMLRHYSLKFGI